MRQEYRAGRRGWHSAIGCCVLLVASALAPAAALAQAATEAEGQAGDHRRAVLVMGDSLSAGYGLRAEESWPALVDRRMAREYPGCRVVNASISGETSAGGSARVVGEVLRHRPGVVVIALGANDGLRGLPLREARRNLARMIGASKHAGARVLLVGMRMPPNLGEDYTRGFERIYRDLAALFGTGLLPFLLEPIALDRDAFQDDNLHPAPQAQERLLAHVWPALAPLLDAAAVRDSQAGAAVQE